MNDPKPTTNVSAAHRDNEKVLGFAIEFENSTRLRIQHNPNNLLFIAASILVLGFAGFLAYNEEILYSIFFSGFVLFLFLQDLTTLRPIRCILDKQAGQFHYTCGKVLGINYNNQDVSGKLGDISQVEMKRHVSRWKDNFQIILLLKNQQRLLLSDRSLDFEDCQKFSEKIRDFLGSDVQVKAVN